MIYPLDSADSPSFAPMESTEVDLPPGQPWPETATAYLARFPKDRSGLISFVNEHCSGPRVQTGPLHQAIAQTGFGAIVTAWYDELLEQSLREAGYRVNRVVRDIQLPYAREGDRETIVIKLLPSENVELLGSSTRIITILDNEAQPSVGIGDGVGARSTTRPTSATTSWTSSCPASLISKT